MNFKENYQKEMNKIEKPSGITEKILNAVDMGQEIYADKKSRNVMKNNTIRRTAVAAIAIVCVLGLCLQREKVIGFAQDVLNRFVLSVNSEEMEFGKLEPVNMDIEGFISDAKTEKKVLGPDSTLHYMQEFTSYQEMKQLTQLELPCADKVEYSGIGLNILPEYKQGHLSATISYQDVYYLLNGMFILDGFDQDSWGYGDEGTSEVYQYGDGKSACFVEDSDGYEMVYFQEGNILFQMSLNLGDNIDIVIGDDTLTGVAGANKEQVKELLDLFGSAD